MNLSKLRGVEALLEIERILKDFDDRLLKLENKKQKEINGYSKGFEEFWHHYPKKKNKGQAQRAWAKLRPDKLLLHNMIEAIKDAKKTDDWKKDGGKFIPHPSSWLNAKGWLDEYTPKKAWKDMTKEEKKEKVEFAKRYLERTDPDFYQTATDAEFKHRVISLAKSFV